MPEYQNVGQGATLINDFSGQQISLQPGQIVRLTEYQYAALGADRRRNLNRVDRETVVDTVQKKWRSDFNTQAAFDSKWDITRPVGNLGYVLGGGLITIAMGVNPNDEIWLTSKETFTLPCRFGVGISPSQRIVNNSFYVEMISVDPVTGVAYPIGDPNNHGMGWLIDSTSITQAKYEVTNQGVLLQSGASTITSIATSPPTQMMEAIGDADACRFYQRVLDSTGSRTQMYVRHQNLPEASPDIKYKLRIRLKNGAVAPASSTDVRLSLAMVVDYNEIVAEISAAQGNPDPGTGLGVNVLGNTVISSNSPGVTISAPSTSANTTAGNTPGKVLSAASTNATSLKGSVGKVVSWLFGNSAATWRYFKLYNKATAPTVGTDVPLFTIGIPPGGSVPFASSIGVQFATGIAYAITAGASDADTAVVGANEVVGIVEYV
jgi:hypothetical protein